MGLKIYTSNISYQGEDKFDITVKTGDLDFAPNWDMVWGHKTRKLSDVKYIEMYTELMNQSYKRFPHKWENLLSRDRVTLVCYCKKGKFCHRKLLAKLIHINFPETEYIGELDQKGNLIQIYGGIK